MFQNQKYSNCGHCSLLSAFLFRVGLHCVASLFVVHLHFSLRKNLHLHSLCYRAFSFVLVDICISFLCWHLHLLSCSYIVLSLSCWLTVYIAFLFRAKTAHLSCWLHLHFSLCKNLHLQLVKYQNLVASVALPGKHLASPVF